MGKPAHPRKLIFVFCVVDCYDLQIVVRLKKSKLGYDKPDLMVQCLLLAHQSQMSFLQVNNLRFIYGRKLLPDRSCSFRQRCLLRIPLFLLALNAKTGPAQAVSHRHRQKVVIRLHPLIDTTVICAHFFTQFFYLGVLKPIYFLLLPVCLFNLPLLLPEILGISQFPVSVFLFEFIIIIDKFYNGENHCHTRCSHGHEHINPPSDHNSYCSRDQRHAYRRKNRCQQVFSPSFFFFSGKFQSNLVRRQPSDQPGRPLIHRKAVERARLRAALRQRRLVLSGVSHHRNLLFLKYDLQGSQEQDVAWLKVHLSCTDIPLVQINMIFFSSLNEQFAAA